ncbi:cytochrome P450 [Pelagicoccus albus]|uniref:Cytochrome P450 n=1 Tax=Pelagicoccus albus TaxID=415222 RepID=A0A7X1B989_9BACT|nr:cytochrome P450 [Pelagicoccus albus]MBC2607892.1 cytochrome P450 [Pelagicoccus albus]
MITELKSLEDIPVFKSHDSVEEASREFLDKPIELLLTAYQECGPIFKMAVGGQWKVILSGYDSNDFMWRNPRNFSYGIGNKPFLEQMGHDHLTGLDGDRHKLKKKILKPAFSMEGAMRYLSIFNREIEKMLSALDLDSPIETAELWARTIIRINSQTVAVSEIDEATITLLSDWEREFLKGLVKGEERHAFFEQPEYLELKGKVFSHFGSIVERRLSGDSSIQDNFAEVLAARSEEENPINREHAANDLYFILLAGVHNTSALINACLHFAYTRPAWLQALREEVEAWDGKDLMALAGMTRLKATIMEAQRLLPAVNLQGKFVTEAFEFKGYDIPAGTHFFHANTLCHFLDEYYENPMSFLPERFVEEGKFVPKTIGFFGGGIHLCLGRNHSMLQTPVALAHVLRKFDLKFNYDPPLSVKLSNPRRSVTPFYPTTFVSR